MILAAGFGTRLKPFSLIKPKPLFPILNRPLLRATIDRLKRSGFDRITINCHHLKEQIREEIADEDGIVIQEEEVILGTGGGLRRALSHLEDEPLLVTNGDIYHTVDYVQLYRHHLESEADVTLALHNEPRFNVVAVTKQQIDTFFSTPTTNCYAYTGIQIINPALLEPLRPDVYSCIIDHYRTMLSSGRSVHCKILEGIYWSDMGTVQDYLSLHGDLLTGMAPIWQELQARPEHAQLVHDGAVIGEGAAMSSWNCIGRAEVGGAVFLHQTVIWDGAYVQSQAQIKDAIIPP